MLLINFELKIKDEMAILKNLHHTNVIEFYGHERIENSLYLYLEYMPLGEFSSFLQF